MRGNTLFMIMLKARYTLLILGSVCEGNITSITFSFILALVHVVGNNILDHYVELGYIHGFGN